MNKHRINSSKKLIGNSNKSRLKTFSSCSKFEEELFEFSLILYDIHSHEKQYSSQMPIPFLGDTQSNITPSRLLNFYILNRFREKLIKLIQLFQKQKENFNFAPKDIFKSLRIYANRLRSKVKDHIRREGRLITFLNIILNIRNFLFKFGYFIGGRRGRLVNKEGLRNNLSIFLMRLRRSKFNFRKSINDRRIDNNTRDIFFGDEKEVDKERGEVFFFLHNYMDLKTQPTYLNLRKQRVHSLSGLESPSLNLFSCFFLLILSFPYILFSL